MPADPSGFEAAASLIQKGEVVGMPTETVYGLAADAMNPAAIAKIFEAKGRPQDNPLIVHISAISMLDELVSAVPDMAKTLAERFWPGPLTMVLPKATIVPAAVTAGMDTVGIRFPSHPAALALIQACGTPLAAPSANLSGKPSPTTAKHVLEDMRDKIPLILDGGSCTIGLESTVIAVNGETVTLLRPGAVTLEMLREVCGNVQVNDAVYHQLAKGAQAASPGMKYKHYAPKAKVSIVEGTLSEFVAYVNAHTQDGTIALVFDGEQEKLMVPCIAYGNDEKKQAQNLFGALRKTDEAGAKRVYARCPGKDGIGLAIYNRLVRAAGFDIISL